MLQRKKRKIVCAGQLQSITTNKSFKNFVEHNMSVEEPISQKTVVISSQMSEEDLQAFHAASANTILRAIQEKNGTIETLIAVFQKLDPEKYHHRERIVKYMLGTVNKEIQQHSKQYVDLLIREVFSQTNVLTF
jgi:hypothetical protein